MRLQRITALLTVLLLPFCGCRHVGSASSQQAKKIDAVSFVRLEPGTYVMGDSLNRQDPLRQKVPAVEVSIQRPFLIGVTEVTQAEYRKVMGENPSYFRAIIFLWIRSRGRMRKNIARGLAAACRQNPNGNMQLEKPGCNAGSRFPKHTGPSLSEFPEKPARL